MVIVSDYPLMAELYGDALRLDRFNPYLHLRRCAALAHLGRFSEALVHGRSLFVVVWKYPVLIDVYRMPQVAAESAVELAPTWWLPRFRRALCFMGLGQVSGSLHA